ncbi:MAG: CHAD domain-containing protein [Gammaproteobacteria bacterium SHHR-1]|uniref:CHAD domain-containing protein n=1 Tax=Magnetovirga frankeli TaxID=947516 RepID=UPI001AF8E330|nr:CHAD domain-containing protein [gamma proteobacterium SS-5]
MQFQLSGLCADEFEQRLGERWPLRQGDREAYRADYLDTFDWRLYRDGLLLLAEQADAGYWLELCAYETAGLLLAGRNEAEPGLLDSLQAPALRQRLAEVVEMRRLLPQACLSGERKRLRLLDDEEKTLVRLELIRAQASGPALAQAGAETKQAVELPPLIRVIGLKGYEAERDRLIRWLEQSDGVLDAAHFYPRLLKAVAAEPGAYSAKLDFSLKPEQRADAAAKQILLFLLGVIEANLEGVKADTDSEFLHDLRVAVRRTRSALSQIKQVFDPISLAHYRQEFGWLGQISGPTRDMDVYLLKFPDYSNSLPEEYRDALEPLHRYLERHQRSEQKKLARRLQSKRLLSLLADWREFLQQPVPQVANHANAVRPVLEVASRRIHRMYKRVMREGRLIEDDSPAEELHELRKSCKKLRYLMEFFQSLYPASEIKSLIKSIKALLDNLGDFQDLEVQAGKMKQMSEELRQSRVSTETLLAIGMLIDGLLERQHQERTRFAQRFAEFASAENRALFDDLFKQRATNSGGQGA